MSLTLPASTSWRIATAVNILFIDPMRKRVRRVFGIRLLRSASPYAWLKSTRPSLATSTAPENSILAREPVGAGRECLQQRPLLPPAPQASAGGRTR